MDGITAEQIRSGQLWEATERKNSALVQVLKQVCSRNKAIERQQLWQQKDREDHGSRSCITLKSRDGEVRSITRVPAGAKVTDNNTNKYARERAKLADHKEDCQLERFCDGNDSAWRPDTFFTDTCGGDDIPPWPIRPSELFTNPTIVMRIMAQQMEKKKDKKLKRKQEKEEGNKDKLGDKSGKKTKKDKKSKKAGKDKKSKKKSKKKKLKKKSKKAADKPASKKARRSDRSDDAPNSSASDDGTSSSSSSDSSGSDST
mmetsp:Transcript_96064/g.275890  ORF Transcript_96064/g.275890 Transcript_96064/m.275890 type:complete len:259 (-) Transcript_96064:69-845(-)|eukprot:CAMPEP_0177216698 /NCGR_PEP_ID=MMETSP0367-20130122/34895_1 /TAXON_ID=447022 ORGANISM="Scrippsiella hangoei-like, Strain SHHI-4" /NCGR_SAMPLE_ID=MMETSP0367 /ASSEMBLY_ACC=CAM_ASM_000362 /LENGTH=258 /DNA_ID=CAMNT_0018666229 /DNA_START=61 /DNA_END=837 /DNA_ORIENTATION=-